MSKKKGKAGKQAATGGEDPPDAREEGGRDGVTERINLGGDAFLSAFKLQSRRRMSLFKVRSSPDGALLHFLDERLGGS